jgi:hypothetical protein
MIIRSAFGATTFLMMSAAAHAAGTSPLSPFVLTSASYVQNFDTLGSTGTSNVLPAGFQIAELGTGGAADGAYAAGTGSSNGGNAYSFGAGGSTERALGSGRCSTRWQCQHPVGRFDSVGTLHCSGIALWIPLGRFELERE